MIRAVYEKRGRVYPFFDGDFSFWVPRFEDRDGPVFRVRAVGQTPEQRHAENVNNPNQARPNPVGFRPATWKEIQGWKSMFSSRFPMRTPAQTNVLRFIKLHGPAHFGNASFDRAARQLADPVLMIRDWNPVAAPLVQRNGDGLWELTKHGEWLTSLML